MKLAAEIMDEAIADSTIDEVLRRDPANLTEADYRALIESLRMKRALFIEGEGKKAAKKQGVSEDGDEEAE